VKPAEKPKVLSVRTGVGSASGGLGVEVTWLLLGGGGLIAATLAVGALLRGKKPEQVGEEPKDPPK
jgi:hypothetical protein